MKITASGCCVLVDGIQFGPKYSQHATAVHEGLKLKNKHYPSADFIDLNPSPDTFSDDRPRLTYAQRRAPLAIVAMG